MRDDGFDAARDLLRNTFGHADFRGPQAGVIGEILAGRSARLLAAGRASGRTEACDGGRSTARGERPLIAP